MLGNFFVNFAKKHLTIDKMRYILVKYTKYGLICDIRHFCQFSRQKLGEIALISAGFVKFKGVINVYGVDG